MRIALVMPVRNEEGSVERTLDAVFASTRLPDELIIVDGLSTDRTVEKIKTYEDRGVQMRVLPNPSRFSGGGRNIGIRAASADIVLLADFGNVVEPAWIEEMVRPFENSSDVEVVTGLHRPLITSSFEHCVAAIHYHVQYLFGRLSADERRRYAPPVIVPGGASLAFTPAVWRRIGGYPEWLPKAQDTLFSRKAYCMGVRPVVSWSACVAHHMRSSPAEVFRQFFAYGRGNARIRCVDALLPKLVAVYAVALALSALSAVAWWSGLLAALLFTAYLYRAGLRKIMTIDGGLQRYSYVWMAVAVLIPRDAGLMAGQAVGWLEWFAVPRYRRLFSQYTQGCDPAVLQWISR